MKCLCLRLVVQANELPRPREISMQRAADHRRYTAYVAAVAVLAGLAGLSATGQSAGAAPSAGLRAAPAPLILDRAANSGGTMVMDSAGTTYLTWADPATAKRPQSIWLCRIPRGGKCKTRQQLSIPAADRGLGVTEPFPAFGELSPKAFYVIAPSYIYGNIVYWISANDGATFPSSRVSPANTYWDTLGVDDVEFNAAGSRKGKLDVFDIVSSGSGDVGFSVASPLVVYCHPGACDFEYKTAPDVFGATLGYDGAQWVMAYWVDSSPDTVYYFWSHVGDATSGWHGPVKVTDGMNVRLASGPSGLYLLSQDFTTATASFPAKLDVRKWDPATHTFGMPTVVARDSAATVSTALGGFGEDPATGALYVAWPGNVPSAGGYVMRLWVSSNKGKTFGRSRYVSTIGEGFGGMVRIAARSGEGFLSFIESAGLALVPLSRL
jgi:hypothetical protein